MTVEWLGFGLWAFDGFDWRVSPGSYLPMVDPDACSDPVPHTQDLVQCSRSGVTVNAGWVRDGERAGHFTCAVAIDEQWDPPAESFATRSWMEAADWLHERLRRCGGKQA